MLNIGIVLILVISKCLALYPVILVPGDGGSQLEAQYTDSPPHYICGFQNRWFLLWLNIYFMFPLTLDCFVQTIRLKYDFASHTTRSPDYCRVRTSGFGTVDTISYLSSLRIQSTVYFHFIVEGFSEKLGYTPNKNILGAPYDFRKAPFNKEEDTVLMDLRRLIIQGYEQNGRKPIVLLGHSMGNLHIVRLLNSVNDTFKQMYIKIFISISGPYGGSVEALKTVLSGNNEHILFLKPLSLRTAQSSWPSTYWLMPQPHLWNNRSLVLTDFGNFTTHNITKLLQKAKIPNSVPIYQDIRSMPYLRAPGVPVYCIYCGDMPTPAVLDYRSTSNFPDNQPVVQNDFGDGTVNLKSLQRCGQWATEQSQPVVTRTLPGLSHLNIVRDPRLVAMVLDIVADLHEE